ncbi:MAG: GIY-YIG nuclease family protein [Planctomycetota bacterium]
MESILRHEPEIGFGVDPLNPGTPRSVEVVGGKSPDSLRQNVVRQCPRVPGVYGMLNPKGELIYVGKSKSLRSRLLSYFADCNAGEKGGRIIEQTRAIQWESQPSEFAALLREQQLIRRLSPAWNVQGVPDRQRPVYLCLARPSAPQFLLAAQPPDNCLAAEGPFFGVKRMNVAVDALNKVFKLRDCSQKQPMNFADQMQLFDLEHRPGCLRYEVGTCLGPCAGACSRQEYDQMVHAAEGFLDGFNDQPVEQLREAMINASQNHQYELAARVRDTLSALEYVQRKLRWMTKARDEYSFVYSVDGVDGCHRWYLIQNGELVDVVSAPRDRHEYQQMRPLVKRWELTLQSTLQRGGGPYAHTLGLVTSWFRRHKSQRERTFLPQNAGHHYAQRRVRA